MFHNSDGVGKNNIWNANKQEFYYLMSKAADELLEIRTPDYLIAGTWWVVHFRLFTLKYISVQRENINTKDIYSVLVWWDYKNIQNW